MEGVGLRRECRDRSWGKTAIYGRGGEGAL